MVVQRHPTRGAPFPTHEAPRMPQKFFLKAVLAGPKARLRQGTFEKPLIEASRVNLLFQQSTISAKIITKHTFQKNIVLAQLTLTLQPLLFWRKSKGNPQKSKGFSHRGTPKILGKERKNAEKSKGNQKTKKARKSKKARIGGSGNFVTFTKHPKNLFRLFLTFYLARLF